MAFKSPFKGDNIVVKVSAILNFMAKRKLQAGSNEETEEKELITSSYYAFSIEGNEAETNILQIEKKETKTTSAAFL